MTNTRDRFGSKRRKVALDFALILVIATIVTGVIWDFDAFFPKIDNH